MQNKRLKTATISQEGFTVVELMIATMVFSVVLVAISLGVTYFTKSYYKSAYDSSTQIAARTIAESISKAIQFSNSGSDIKPPELDGGTGDMFICAGGYIFVYKVGQKYTGSGSTGFYEQPLNGNCTSVPTASNQKQLLSKNMRVTDVSLEEKLGSDTGPNSYSVKVTVAYGDDDVLTSATGENVACRSDTGAEYCSVATINSTVSPRIAK